MEITNMNLTYEKATRVVQSVCDSLSEAGAKATGPVAGEGKIVFSFTGASIVMLDLVLTPIKKEFKGDVDYLSANISISGNVVTGTVTLRLERTAFADCDSGEYIIAA